MRGAGVLLVGRGPADDRLQHDDRGAAGLRLGGGERGVDRGEVLAVVDVLDVPAVGLVALADVLGEGDVRVVLDGDPVVVVDEDEVAQLLGAGQRGGLAADALLQVAVGGERPDGVVEQALALGGVGVEQAALAAGGHGHADGVADALAQRAGRRLDAGGVVDLGVARGLRAPGAQRLEVGELQAVAGEVELDVERQARVPHREHEPVAARPSSGRWGRAAATSGRAGRRSGPCSSPCPGGRCRPSGRRPSRARARCRWRGGRARRSRRAGWGAAGAGLPVGASVAASAGASDPVLCVMWWVLPRGRPVRSRRAVAGPVPRWTGRVVVVDVRPTRCARSINAINPSHPRSCRAVAGRGPGYSDCGSRPRFERGPVLCPACAARRRARGHPVTALSERQTEPPAGLPAVLRAPAGRLRRAHQAADHRAAAGHDGAGDDAGRRRLAVLAAARSPPWSAARSPPARPTSSTATTTATSTG